MIEAARVAPNSVPRILASDADAGIFAMTYYDPSRYPVWKQELHAGRVDPSFAAQVGQTTAAIHSATAGSRDLARRFANDATFHSIRVEPYIEATARVHADLAAPLMRLAEDTLSAKRTLVHGDVSPKNILVGPAGPVFLDAECAWFGEPAFDLRSVSTISCSNASGRRRRARLFSRASTPSRRAISPPSIGSRRPISRRAPLVFSRRCCSRASTASRRSNTSPPTPTRIACGGSRAR